MIGSGSPGGRWETFNRIRINRQNRLRAKTRKRRGDSESDFNVSPGQVPCHSCPGCHGRLQRTPEEIQQHIEECLKKSGNGQSRLTQLQNSNQQKVMNGNGSPGLAESNKNNSPDEDETVDVESYEDDASTTCSTPKNTPRDDHPAEEKEPPSPFKVMGHPSPPTPQLLPKPGPFSFYSSSHTRELFLSHQYQQTIYNHPYYHHPPQHAPPSHADPPHLEPQQTTPLALSLNSGVDPSSQHPEVKERSVTPSGSPCSTSKNNTPPRNVTPQSSDRKMDLECEEPFYKQRTTGPSQFISSSMRAEFGERMRSSRSEEKLSSSDTEEEGMSEERDQDSNNNICQIKGDPRRSTP